MPAATAPSPIRHLRIEHAATPSETDMVSLARLVIDRTLQPRADGLDRETIKRYADLYREVGARALPPVVAFAVDNRLLLASGFHRHAAAHDAGLAKIPVLIRKGHHRDALLFALQANGEHGLPLTNTDKRRILTKLLSDDEWRQWSDREIAARIHVSPTFVGNLRKELGAQTETRKAKNGAMVSTKGIREAGKKRAEKNAAAKAATTPATPAPAAPAPTAPAPIPAAPISTEPEVIGPPKPIQPLNGTMAAAFAAANAKPLPDRRAAHVRELIAERLESGKLAWKRGNAELLALALLVGVTPHANERWSTTLATHADYLVAVNVAAEIAQILRRNANDLARLPVLPELCALFALDYQSLVIIAERAITA